MMFGAWGNPDTAISIGRDRPPGARRGDQLHRHRRRLLGGESEEIVGKALTGRRDDIVLATKSTADERRPEPRG